VVGPLGLGFLVYTFLLLIRFLFDSAEMIIRRGLPVAVVGKLLAFTLPNIVVLTIPMALLFGILIAVGRLSSDSELVALRAGGVSLATLYRPILLVSAAFALLNGYLMVDLLPRGNSGLQQLRLDIITETVSQQVEPRVFYPEFEGLLLYVFEIPKGDDRWNGVFLAQALPTSQNKITVAEYGRIKLDEAGEQVVLELENAYTHEIDLNEPDRYDVTFNQRVEQVLEDSFTSTQRAKIVRSKGLRELTLGELAEVIDDPTTGAEQRNLARVEIHKKFAIPAACLVFGLFALPLGFNNRRGGKASGFALSLLVILVYYILLNNGEEAARFGKVPAWLAMWLPNIVLSIGGVLLLARRNRDKSLLLSRLDRWVRGDLWQRLLVLSLGVKRRRAQRRRRREAAAQAAVERGAGRGPGPGEEQPEAGAAADRELVLRLPRPRLRFPNTLDRYVVRQFGLVFLLALFSGLTIYIVADLSENVDEIIKNQVPRAVVVSYYKYLSLQIFYEIAPILVLVTTLITFSLLSRSSEVTACKALGVSLYRLALPALAAAALVVLGAAYLESAVLPASNQRVAQLKDRIKARETVRTYRRADRQWLFAKDRYVYNYLHYDPRQESLQRLQVFEFDDSHRLASRLFASRAVFRRGQEWIFEDGWVRRFDGADVTTYRRFTEPRIVDYPETPEYFESEIRTPEQMSFGELRGYIEELEASGQAVPELKVELQNKLAFPVVSLVMALVALPFAFRLGRQGALYGVGLSIFLGMVFMVVFALFNTLGEAGALPPTVAVWSPGALFSMLAGYLFLGVRT
jgi:LPS export ABC transporter permease LptG/LPS export ABC transporter permease LptF